MTKLHHFLVAAALASGALGATAQSLKPGLWEINNKMSGGSGTAEKALTEAQKQLANMPPDQRKMMENMMANQGVGINAGGAMTAKVCMTQEMIDHNEVPTQQGDCKQTTSPRTGNTMKFSFVCTRPPASGEGQVTFVSPEAYTLKMTLNTMASGKPETMNMDATGRFVSTACGNIKPMSLPKQ
jgi:hypothetical protein